MSEDEARQSNEIKDEINKVIKQEIQQEIQDATPAMDDAARRRELLTLTALNILSNITVPLAGLVDKAMLGRLDELRFLDGVALGTIIFDYAYWSFGFLRMATTGLVARAEGERDPATLWQTVDRGLMTAAAIGLLLWISAWPLRELGLVLLGGSPAIQDAARDYFNARILAAPITLANYVILGTLLGRGRSGRVLILTVISNLANVGLNLLLIGHFQLAAQGAGLATAGSQAIMLVVGLILLPDKRTRPAISLAALVDRDKLGEVFRLNRDIMVRTFALISAFSIFQRLSLGFSEDILAVNTLLLGVVSFASFAIDGAAFAVETHAGRFAGQGRPALIRKTVRDALIVAFAFALLVIIPALGAPRAVMGLLTDHEHLLAMASALMPFVAAVIALGSAAYVFDGLFIGLSNGRVLRNAVLIALAGYLPVALLATRIGSVRLLWSALAGFMVLRSGYQAYRFLRSDALDEPEP